MACETLRSQRTLPHTVPASLRVTVLDRDGAPLAGVKVGEEETDDAGTVVLSGRLPEPYDLVVRADGRLPARASGALAEGAEASITVREPKGARVEVTVVDEAGRPRPSTLLDLGERVVFDVVDGVQRLDLYTDADGRRTLERVEPGRVTIRATWGTRHGHVTVDLEDGVTTEVRIVAP